MTDDNLPRDYLLIEDIDSADRPREKAMRLGLGALSNAELIAILFGNGMKGKSVLTLAQELLARNEGKLSAIARKSIRDIVRQNPGIGPAKAISYLAAIELGARCQEETPAEKPVVRGSSDAYRMLRRHLDHLDHEEFWIMVMTRSNRVVDTFRASSGGTSATVVDPRIVFRRILAMSEPVAAIILAHNHPSGNLTPSREDDALTTRLRDGARLFDITVADHIITAHDRYYSYRDEGRL